MKRAKRPKALDPVEVSPRLRVAIDKIVDQEEREFPTDKRALVHALRGKSLVLTPAERARMGAKIEVALAIDDMGDIDPRPNRRPTWLPADVTVEEAKRKARELSAAGNGSDAIARIFHKRWPSSVELDSIARTVRNWLGKKRLRKT